MLSARFLKAWTYTGERMRIQPAWHTSPTPRASSSRTSAASEASRSPKSLGFSHRASTPAARARSRATARSRSEITTATRAGKPGRAHASRMAWRLEPRPEARTPRASVTRRPAGRRRVDAHPAARRLAHDRGVTREPARQPPVERDLQLLAEADELVEVHRVPEQP